MAKNYYQGYGTRSTPIPREGLALYVDEEPFSALENFFKLLRLQSANKLPQVIEEVLFELNRWAEPYILNLIENSNFEPRYKAFMVARTKVIVEYTGNRAMIVISGRTENELGSAGKGGEYNIWAVQEFGYSFGEITPKNPDSAGYGRFNFGFNKDTGGGIIARMKTIPARTISKNKGLIQQLIRSHEVQLRQQIALQGNQILAKWITSLIDDTAKKIGFQVIKGGTEHAGFLQSKGFTPEVMTGAGIKSIETFNTGQTVFRGAKGQFVSQKLGGNVSITTLGK